MIKLFGALLVILGSSLLGLSYSIKLGERLEELKIVKRIFIYLRGEIEFAKSTLPESFEHIGKKIQEPYQTFLIAISKELLGYEGKGFSQVFAERVDSELKKSALLWQDKERLKKTGEFLGFLDAKTQIQTIDLYIKELDEQMELVAKTMVQKRKVYQSLGVLGGIFMAILLV